MARSDISHQLIHFTRGESVEDAFSNLCRIVEERTLRGSGTKIREGHVCVCFTEAPLALLPGGLVSPEAYSRYSPFGVVFDKSWIFSLGGRPVIYQPEDEFDALPATHRWRHMRYEPTASSPIDLTWEREWRLATSTLAFDPAHAGIVLPAGDWTRRLMEAHDERQAWLVLEYSQILGMHLAEQYSEELGWRIAELGAKT